MARPQPPDAEICLLLEGTYPYVAGGVSTWVHQLLNACPEWRFAIFYIGGQRDQGAKFQYEVPANVVAIEEVYLFDPKDYRPHRGSASVPAAWQPFYDLLRKFLDRTPTGAAAELETLLPLMQHIMAHPGVSFDAFFHARETWDVLRALYLRHAGDDSFLHFFWTCRDLVEPLWKLALAMPRVPKARVYHTACTGYAGILGAILSRQSGAPLLLSEHGIYVKERIQDIYRSPWIAEFPPLRPALEDPLGSLRRLWIGFFDVLARHCYAAASQLVSLFGRNARVQADFGAPPEKISIIANGLPVESCDALLQRRATRRAREPQSRVVGFLGRIVSIKDVKTLLRTARLVCDALPDARFLIAGPTDEEPEYHRDCVELTQQLQLADNVRFVGMRQRDEVLPLLDVMLLTSISEGLPFVLLEAMAVGMPIVSTDVGACRELVEGRQDENPPLGPCGFVTSIGDSDQLARALVCVLTDREVHDQMSRAGRARVERHYHERDVLGSYRRIYERLMASSSTAPAPSAIIH
jgi:glycosyltransferase involved in cell wall biosynthesis